MPMAPAASPTYLATFGAAHLTALPPNLAMPLMAPKGMPPPVTLLSSDESMVEICEIVLFVSMVVLLFGCRTSRTLCSCRARDPSMCLPPIGRIQPALRASHRIHTVNLVRRIEPGAGSSRLRISGALVTRCSARERSATALERVADGAEGCGSPFADGTDGRGQHLRCPKGCCEWPRPAVPRWR